MTWVPRPETRGPGSGPRDTRPGNLAYIPWLPIWDPFCLLNSRTDKGSPGAFARNPIEIHRPQRLGIFQGEPLDPIKQHPRRPAVVFVVFEDTLLDRLVSRSHPPVEPLALAGRAANTNKTKAVNERVNGEGCGKGF